MSCVCGFKINDNMSKSKDVKCTSVQALKNHITFPSLNLMPFYMREQSSIYYNEHSNTTRHWAILVQLDQLRPNRSFFPCDTWASVNSYGEIIGLTIYKDYSEDEKPTTFNCSDLKKDKTLAILYADKVSVNGLMINYINYDTCYCFNAPLQQVQREAEKLLRDADLMAQNQAVECFECGIKINELNACANCKMAKYCSKVCKDRNLTTHKSLCSQSNMLLRLASLPRHSFTEGEQFSFRNIDDEGKIYNQPMPNYKYVQEYSHKSIESRVFGVINQNKMDVN